MRIRSGDKSEPLQRFEAEVEHRRVVYGVAGEGPAVVLIHGLSASSRWWNRTVPALNRRYRVYAVDLPGFGNNQGLGLLKLDEMATWLLSWIDAVGISRAHLIGHSMGGFVAVNLAVRAPERVERLVLVDPVVRPFARPWTEPITSLLAEMRQMPRAFLPTLIRDFSRAGMLNVNRAAHAVVRADVRAQLANVQAPTLVIWGARDALVPAIVADEIVNAIPDCRLVVIEGAGHTPMWDQADEFNRVVIDFLNE